MQFQYVLAMFDVLGFKQRFETLGLTEIARRYDSLIGAVDAHNEHIGEVFGDMGFAESVYWAANGDVVPFNRVFGGYASDSILVWAHEAWPEARGKTPEERHALSSEPRNGWMFRTVPCDAFLSVCNELVCHSIEVGLPLRGAMAMGTAILDETRRVFLGAPLIEAASLERGQRMIGASWCTSFAKQTIPPRYGLAFANHIKEGYHDAFAGDVLDWPRNWRHTRSASLRTAIRRLGRGAGAASTYYENTLSLLSCSDERRHHFEAPEDISIRTAYKAFGSPALVASVKAVRRTGHSAR